MEIQKDLIFDVGMHIGQDTEFYLKQGYRVLAIEASPVLAEAGKQKFAREIAGGRLEILNVGIFETEGVADFWICEAVPEWNSFNREIASRDGYPHHAIPVPTMHFGSILKKYGVPYYLKVDIEGCDQLCLKDLPSFPRPPYLSIESECIGDRDVGTAEEGLEALQKLRDLGYRKFKLVHQETLVALSVPRSLEHRLDRWGQFLRSAPCRRLRGAGRLSRLLLQRERLARRLNWQFPLASTGPWGEDTPGKWLDYDKAAQVYCYYREQHFSHPSVRAYTFWCDWHAKMAS